MLTYKWNGVDQSITTNSAVVFTPAVAPVQLDYYSGGLLLPERYKNSFFLAASGWVTIQGPSPGKGVLSFQYDPNTRTVTSIPEYLIQYTGTDYQAVVGVGVGKDGIYFVPLYPVHENSGAVLKVQYKSGYVHSKRIGFSRRGDVIIVEKGCMGCHTFSKEKETIGPTLDAESMIPRIQSRLNSTEYRKSIESINHIPKEPYRSYMGARSEVLKAKGMEQVLTWLRYHLVEPKFDNPKSQMPNTGLTIEQATALAEYLVAKKPVKKKKKKKDGNVVTTELAPPGAVRWLLIGTGIVIGLVVAGITSFAKRRRHSGR